MVYVLLPNSGESLGFTRPQIRNNFVEIKNSFDVNHNDFDATDTGKHKFVQIPLNISPGTTATELAIFSKNDAASIPRLWIQERGNVSGAGEQQLTGSVVKGGGATFYSETVLYGGFKIKFGSMPVTTSNTLTWGAMGLSNFTNVFGALVNRGSAGLVGAYAIATNTNLTIVTSTATPQNIFFIAIGN